MGIKSFISKLFANFIVSRQNHWARKPVDTQINTLLHLIKTAQNTSFGKEHGFINIKTHDDFVQRVPVKDYEGLAHYIEKVKKGETNILWPGKPLYFAKTSGTTSGTKYIPITKDSISNHINGARDALLNYIYETGKANFLDGKLMFISGSPEMQKKNGVFVGRLSGIVNHHVPRYLKKNQLPTYEVNCIEDWETKIEAIVSQTKDQPMSLISGIPPWVQMYFDKLNGGTAKKIKDIFPKFALFVYGGVNFDPYKKKLFEAIGKTIDSIETYPASEGFIAFQNKQDDKGLLLLLNSGIFYEFIPTSEYFSEKPTRLTIGEVELGINYALIMSTNAGLWAYSIGDTVKFVSKIPYKIVVTGRIKHFISAFGEHVIGEEVEQAMRQTLADFPHVQLTEYTVAPQVTPLSGLPYHEWFIEFSIAPKDIEAFAKRLDIHMMGLNTYYKDLIDGSILRTLVIFSIPNGGFIEYMKTIGRLGGQNKVPRLANDRQIADVLSS